MLEIISGAMGSNAHTYMENAIRQAVCDGKQVVCIIPDQFSFEYDKKLYKLLGIKGFNKISTIGFNRCGEIMGKEFGSYAGENATDNAKTIMMYTAVQRLRRDGGAKYYAKNLNKGSFVKEFISLVTELRQSGITPQDISLCAGKFEGMLSNKLTDIAKLYQYYMEGLEKNCLHDSITTLAQSVELAYQYEYFKNKTVFIDAFHSFTFDEMNMIKCILRQADDVTAGLVISNAENSRINLTPFAETIKTRQSLEKIAEQFNIETRNICADKFEYNSPALEFLNRNVFSLSKIHCEDNKNIKIITASDCYEEGEYVCSEILRLVREENYAYKDIAVLTRDPAAAQNILSGIFKRYDIPCFIDAQQKVSQSAFVMYIMTIFRCVLTKQLRTENILRYIKSPLSNILDFQISMIEDYCISWNVEGDMWLADFTAADSNIRDKQSYIEKVNTIRRKIVQPLVKFKSACIDTDAKTISHALYDLLGEIELSQKSFSLVRTSMGSDDEKMLEMSRTFRQLWEMVVSCISAVYKNIPDEKISLRQYYELMKVMMSQLTISSPPQRIDSVIIADSSHSRLNNMKAVFVMGCNDGVFPADIKAQGLISESDKQKLKEINIDISQNVISRIHHERMVCYTALCTASDKLYITYPESDSKGAALRPSALCLQIATMYDDITLRASSMPIAFYCPTYKTSYYKYLERSKDKSADISAVKQCLEANAEYKARLDYIRSINDKKNYSLAENNAHNLFFAKDFNISASRIETYSQCPFSYFCRYGLKIEPPAEDKTDPRNRGLFVHYCLEKIISYTDENGEERYDENFKTMDETAIRNKVHRLLETYVEEALGGDFGKSARFEYITKRWEDSAYHVVRNLRDELNESMFEPVAFEYSLTKENDESILEIESENQYKISIRGSIDRVDIFSEDDENGVRKRYVRIVDYKTGHKKLSLSDLYNGLNLQMIIYLLAITKSDNSLTQKGSLTPAGVLYMPAVHVNADSKSDSAIAGAESDILQLAEDYRDKHFRRFGLIVDNKITIEAMQKRAGRFENIVYKKDGEISSKSDPLYTPQFVEDLESFAMNKVRDMSNRLYNGEISADPLENNKKLPCSYCDYWAVCGKGNPKKPRKADIKADSLALIEELKSYHEEGGNPDEQ